MNELKEFKRFVDEIIADNSRLAKIAVLEKYRENESVKYFLDFIYNPYIITGISEKKLSRDVSNVGINETSFSYIPITDFRIFDYIKKFNTGRDVDIALVQNFRNRFVDKELYTLYNSIITKNLQLGIDTKTINKVIPGLIPEFNVQLANKYFDNPSIVEGKEFALTTKIDGSRIIAIKENREVSFFTRAGQKYEGLVDLEEDLKRCPEDNFVFDGELTLLDKGNLTSKDQYKETMKISRRDGVKHGLKMLVFDWLPVEGFKNQKCDVPYLLRRACVEDIFNLDNFTYFEKLPVIYQGTDTNQIMYWLNYNIAHGEEGVMINIVDAPYEFKRCNTLLKVKKMNDLDLEVIGFEEGTNRNKGRLGALLVNYKNNIVKVGSGFSEELREEIWNNQDKWLGKTVVVQYFEETQNQNGGISLRFPVYLDYRTDK